MKVIIIAAGKGNRLMPLTQHTPKSLIEIHGKPILLHILDALPQAIDNIIVVVNYLEEKIKETLGHAYQGKPIAYATQRTMQGTFGALLAAKDFVSPGERFLVVQGDDLHDKEELAVHLAHPRSFGIQKALMPGYHSVLVDNHGMINGFGTAAPGKPIFVATGVYVADSHVFDHPGIRLRDGEYGLPQTLLAQRFEYPLTAVISHKWIPINTFDDLEKARRILAL